MDHRPAGVDHALRAACGQHFRLRPDGGDAPAIDRDGAGREAVPLRIHGDDEAVLDDDVALTRRGAVLLAP